MSCYTAADRVYVGNLAWSVTDQSLAAHMASAGEVVSATVLKRYDGRSKVCVIHGG